MAEAYARPLIVRCGAFGDMVLITALIRALSQRFDSPVDILTSGPWSEPLLSGQPGVGEVYTVRSRKTPFWLAPDQRRLVQALSARGAGPIWYCDANDAARRLLTRAGVGDEAIVDVKEHPLAPGEHAVQQWRRLSQVLPSAYAGVPASDLSALPEGCLLEVSDPQRRDLDQWLRARSLAGRALLLVQIGNKRTMRAGLKRLATNHKYWPQERWAQVLRFIRQRHPRHALALIGTGPEHELNRLLLQAAGVADAFNLADDLPVPRLVALLERAHGLLTVDSGPAHAAAAVGCPQVVLFGKALVSLYRPWGVAGADVQVVTGTLDGEPSMLGIEPRQVTEAWSALRLRQSS